MSNSNSITAAAAAAVGVVPADQCGAPPPLPHHRRPRVREVSSRFMSPAHSSSFSSSSSSLSAGDLHTLTMKSPISRSKHSISSKPSPSPSQRRVFLRSQEHEPLSTSSHENIPETFRSMDTPFNYAKPDSFSTQQRKRAVKLFKENGYGEQMQISKSSSSSSTIRKSCSRPDTPSAAATDRIVPSRFRQPQCQTSSSVSDAAKLLQSSFSSSSYLGSQNLNESEAIQGGSCPNSPLTFQHNRTCTLPDTTRSSMTYEDNLSTTRSLLPSSSSSKFSTPSLCSRSLNLPLSNNSFKSTDRSLSKPSTASSSVSIENRTLPPQPTSTKIVVDLKKVKKTQSSQEQVHSLKLLHNHYLLWRFANAKAQASMSAQKMQIENQFFSLGADISQLRDTVKRKQVELAVLQQINALSTILEAQMPYLDEWSALEEDYTHSLSGTTSALTNSLLRLPVSGNVQVNIKEAAEALDLAVKTTDMIVHHMQTFFPKAEEMDSLMSELATVIDGEKALVEECGSLLAKTQTLEVEDCSLRGHLMQLSCSNLL